jgi:hypothetical protein
MLSGARKYTVVSNADDEGDSDAIGTAVLTMNSAVDNNNNNSNDDVEDNVGDDIGNGNEQGYRNLDTSDAIDTDDISFVTANTNSVFDTPSTQRAHNPHSFIDTDVNRRRDSTSRSRMYNMIFRTTLLSDDTIKVYNILFAESAFAIKLCKFTVFTFIGIWTMFYFVRFMVRINR